MDRNATRRTFLRHSSMGVAGLGGARFLRALPATAEDIPGKTDIGLTEKIEALVRSFLSDAGIYVRHLPSGRSVAVRADELFPTESLIKTAILLALFDKIHRGELSFHGKLVYDGTYTYKGMNEDILSRFKTGEDIRLSKLIMLMITISDNSASIWLQELAGGGTAINSVLEANGFRDLRINARTPGREEAYDRYGWGQTTPRELCELFVKIRQGSLVSPASCEEMYRILTRIYWNGESLSEIPPYVQVASKQGALNKSRSEVVLVNAPSGDYVFCVITKNQQDESWEDNNEGFVLLRDVSRLLWRHFEPGHGWEHSGKIETLNR